MQLLFSVLKEAPVNQFPTYAEKMMGVLRPGDFKKVSAIIEARLEEMNTESKRKRLLSLLKHLKSK